MTTGIFMCAVAFIAACAVTWFILWFFFSSPGARRGTFRRPKPPAGNALRDRRITELRWLTTLGAALTTPVLIVSLISTLRPGLVPPWLGNPWFEAILVTPVMFYCGRSIHNAGLPAIAGHRPDMNSLVSLGTWAAYLYGLVVCVAPWALPSGTRDPYFESVGVIITLTLLSRLLDLSARAESPDGAVNAPLGSAPMQHVVDSISRILVPVVMIIAVWTFAGWLVLGPQPRPTHALVTSVSVLIIACPCALGLATPLSVDTALDVGKANGLLITSARVLEHARELQGDLFSHQTLVNAPDGPGEAERIVQVFNTAGLSISLGTGHTEGSAPAADVTVVDGSVAGALKTIRLSEVTMRTIRQNLAWALGFNIVGIPIAVGVFYPFTGWLLSPTVAGFVMLASSLCVLLNTSRLRHFRLAMPRRVR